MEVATFSKLVVAPFVFSNVFLELSMLEEIHNTVSYGSTFVGGVTMVSMEPEILFLILSDWIPFHIFGSVEDLLIIHMCQDSCRCLNQVNMGSGPRLAS